ncbi:hypothetical protein L1887_58843 [Cichorium endivia]|nr:hypothetical protein L1887_58843 [Cichorium endivia]
MNTSVAADERDSLHLHGMWRISAAFLGSCMKKFVRVSFDIILRHGPPPERCPDGKSPISKGASTSAVQPPLFLHVEQSGTDQAYAAGRDAGSEHYELPCRTSHISVRSEIFGPPLRRFRAGPR